MVELSNNISRTEVLTPLNLKNFTPWCKVAYKRILYKAEKKHIPAIKTITPAGIELLELIRKISLIRLMVNGPPKLDIINKNQKIEMAGCVDILPLLIKALRECLRSYIILAHENIPGEVKPWHNITRIRPTNPCEDASIEHTNTSLICTTDEYAIITFISVNRVIVSPNIMPPIGAVIRSSLTILAFQTKIFKKTNPSPPSFNINPAKIIDPLTGAST